MHALLLLTPGRVSGNFAHSALATLKHKQLPYHSALGHNLVQALKRRYI